MEAVTNKQELKQQRMDAWANDIQSDIKQLLNTASSLQKEIAGSKTQTKRSFYQKKFNKVRKELFLQMAAVDRLSQLQPKPDVVVEAVQEEVN